MLSKLGIRKANMEKVTFEAPHVINDLVQAVLKLIQVMYLGEEWQKVGVYCVEYILNWSIDGPIKSTEKIVVAFPSD